MSPITVPARYAATALRTAFTQGTDDCLSHRWYAINLQYNKKLREAYRAGWNATAAEKKESER